MNVYDEQVDCGIALLNQYFGHADWLKKIDPDALDMREWSCCSGGQVFGDFSDALDALFPEIDEDEIYFGTPEWDVIAKYGFGIDNPSDDEDERDDQWAKLTECWREKLAQLAEKTNEALATEKR